MSGGHDHDDHGHAAEPEPAQEKIVIKAGVIVPALMVAATLYAFFCLVGPKKDAPAAAPAHAAPAAENAAH